MRTPDFCPGVLRLAPKGAVVEYPGANGEAEARAENEKQEGCKGDEDRHRSSLGELFEQTNDSVAVCCLAIVPQSFVAAGRVNRRLPLTGDVAAAPSQHRNGDRHPA